MVMQSCSVRFSKRQKKSYNTKPMMGMFKKAGTNLKRHLAEFKNEEYNLGDTITVELFNDVEISLMLSVHLKVKGHSRALLNVTDLVV